MNNELYEKMARLQWMMHRQQMQGYHRGGNLADATRGQGRILAALQMQDGISTKDLSYLLGLSVSSLNEFLLKLEKGSYIIREQSEQDKRVILVKLTEKGKEQQAQQEDPSNIENIFDCLTEDEQESFGQQLDKIFAALCDRLGFSEEEFEHIRMLRTERDRMFSAGFGPDRGGFDPHGFGGDPRGFMAGFGGMGRGRGFFGRRGFPDGREGSPDGRNFGGKERDIDGKDDK